MKFTRELINVRGISMKNNNNFKIKKDEELYTRYSQSDNIITHILCKKLNTEPNKMWILLAIESDGTLTKIAQGANPLILENKIDYIKSVKDKQLI